MNTQKKKIILIFVCTAIIVCGIFFVLQKQKGNTNQNINGTVFSAETPKKEVPTQGTYKTGVRDVLLPYLTLRKTLPALTDASRSTKESAATRTARDAVLSLLVTSESRDIHLELVLALTQIEQGILDKNVALWQQGETNLDSFLKKNPWAEGK